MTINKNIIWGISLTLFGLVVWILGGLSFSFIFFVNMNILLRDLYVDYVKDRDKYKRLYYWVIPIAFSLFGLNYLQREKLLSPYLQIGLSTLLTLLFWGICYYYSYKWKQQE